MNWRQLRSRIDSWIRSLNAVAGPGQSPNSPQSVAAQPILAVLAQFASGILSSLMATWLAQDILRYSFPLVVVLSFALFFLFSTILQTRWLPLRLNIFYIFTIMLTIIIILGVVLGWLYASTRPQTVYLVLDATVKAKPNFEDFRRYINFTSQVQPTNGMNGLRVYGGNMSGVTDCNNTKQIIAPEPAIDYANDLESVLKTLAPAGNASLTIAVLNAVRDDLKQYRGPIKLIVITSGIDQRCEPPEGGIFERIAQDIRENTRNDISIAIISVGKLPSEEEKVLESYAKAFNGTYLNTLSASDLPAIILSRNNYLSGYSTRSDSSP